MPERRSVPLVSFVGLQPMPLLARFSLRGELAALAGALSIPISRSACRAVEGELCAALWLGPDEQLLLAPEQNGARLMQALQAGLASVPHSLVDVSHRQTGFEVSGLAARRLLNAGCPLDLADPAFPIGMCTRTLFEKSEIVLWRTAPDTFHIEVARSFAPYLTGLLAEVAREEA